MTVQDKFLRYVQVETTSDHKNPNCPSTPGQLTLGKMLVEEMQAMGITDARMDKHGYVYGTVPAKGDRPGVIGLIAHMDTSDGVLGPTHPQVIHHYDGGTITLKNGVTIEGFHFLPSLKGHDLIVTDGTSVLGGDDKAGVAEIMTLAQRMMAPDSPDHCTIRIGFTPDEEIGRGADLFDVAGFAADYAYTVDGGEVGELEYENFNAASLEVIIHGVNIHPGTAKNKMVNAALLAMEWQSMLPPFETPAHTEGYEGFYHLQHMEGNEELATLRYLLRDFEEDGLANRKAAADRITAYMNEKYGAGTVEITIRDNYQNMRTVLQHHPEIIQRAKDAFQACGVKPIVIPIRGGTDGARLSFMGLPCPNLSTGAYNGHGRRELVTIQGMEKMVDVLQALVTR